MCIRKSSEEIPMWCQRIILDFLQTFLQLYKQKTEELIKQAERLNVGIVRIDEASVLIQEMDRKLEKQRKELGQFSSDFKMNYFTSRSSHVLHSILYKTRYYS